MSAWRLTAAAAAFCLLASSPTVAAESGTSQDTSPHYNKHKVSHDQRPRAHALHRRSRRLAQHRRTTRTAAHHRKLHHVATRLETSPLIGPGVHDIIGTASYYWEGERVATGARYNPDGLTAAHRTLPFGTRLRVTDLVSNRSVVVTVNDRGPFVAGRVLDLSRGAALALGMTERGLTRIKASVI